MERLTLLIAAILLVQSAYAYTNDYYSSGYNGNGLHYSPEQVYGANYPYTSNPVKVPSDSNHNKYNNNYNYYLYPNGNNDNTNQNVLPPSPTMSLLPPPYVPYPSEFGQAINQYVNSIQKQIASGGSFAYATPGASAYAYTSAGQANLMQQQQSIWNAWRNNIEANSVPYTPPSYASASAQYSPIGFQQFAAIHPPNRLKPNVDTKFANVNPNGFYGISTAAFSSSSNVNGVENNRRAAYTTVNDNGKISTYKVES